MPRSSQIQPNPPKSNQSRSKLSKSSQTHPKMLPFLYGSNELFQIQQKSTYIWSKSTVILSSRPKSTQFQSDVLKSAQIHPNNSNSQIIEQLQYNSPNQIQIFKYSQINPNPFQSAKSLKSCQICPDQQQMTKSSRTGAIYPNKPKTNSIVKLQRNPFKPVSIHLHKKGIQYWIHKLPAFANYTNNYISHKISSTWFRRCRRQRR